MEDALTTGKSKPSGGSIPLKAVYFRKVKTLKAPKFDITKLMEVHGNASEGPAAPVPGSDEGTKLDRPSDGL